ncbi:MAG: stage 0 sporulation family protein [Spirochaetaceae bacterium]|nr:stage 0 sporulation family protein [Spirochaetaceae bacterium]
MNNETEDELEKLEDAEDDALEDLSVVAETIDGPITAPVYHVLLEYSHDTFFAVYAGEPLAPGETVVVPTRYGRDLARLIGPVKNPEMLANARITRIERPATSEDLAKAKRNKESEQNAFQICKEKIKEHGLVMKLVMVHYLLEEAKILFFFTADSRVDFRDLVKDLVSAFRTRIELRQIGIRDESRICGGLGICGRSYCCHTISEKLKSVTIKMAKDQNLSLNSLKISGSCGRLLCCLAYEYNYYAEQRKFYPPEGQKFTQDGADWYVREVNVIAGTVTLDTDDGRQRTLPRAHFEKTGNTWRIINP